MATTPLSISADTQKRLISYASKVLQRQKAFSEFRTKLEVIDRAYARYRETAVNTSCEAPADVFAKDRITPPIVMSQVESLVAYWSEVYLDGYPLFPVASMPNDMKVAEKLEALLDEHATIGGYARQLLLFFQDCAKYNCGFLEVNWAPMRQYNVLVDFLASGDQQLENKLQYYTQLQRRDPYNCIWDYSVLPGDVAAKGDYAGFVEILNRVKLKTLLNQYTQEGAHYNIKDALKSSSYSAGTWPTNYNILPKVSNYVDPRRPEDQYDWDAYLGAIDNATRDGRDPGKADNYEVFTLYCRIIPSDFGLPAPQRNTPQIWKLVIINGEILVHVKRIVTANDHLPILVGQPLEDGFGYQTQSIAEGAIEFQEGAATLFNIRFAAARRAVSDRALYDAEAISMAAINSPAAAAKIPVRLKGIKGKNLADVYKAIPFDMRGTETAIQDATIISSFAKDLRGLNNARQGQFQRGNKSVQEWTDTMGNSDARLRMSALVLQNQVFIPLKETLKLNIYQFGENTSVVSQASGELLDINIGELRDTVLKFKLSDGYTPKAKLVSLDMLNAGFQMIASVPLLQQMYGPGMPKMFAHMMSLGGVRGLDQYSPNEAEVQANMQMMNQMQQQAEQPQEEEEAPPEQQQQQMI